MFVLKRQFYDRCMKRFLLLLFISSHTALGQSVDSTQALPLKSNYKAGIILELGATLGFTNFPAATSLLNSSGSQPSTHFDLFINTAIGVRYGRFKLMLGSGYGLGNASSSNEDSLITRLLGANNTGFLLGFDVVNTRNRRLFINAGLGRIGYEYSVYRRASQVVPLQNLPQYNQPANIPSLSLANTYWDVNIEYTQREKGKRSAQNVLRLGYRRGIRPDGWKSDAFQLVRAPADRISQFYIQGTIYFSSNYARLGR
jgi:hypothetical protein